MGNCLANATSAIQRTGVHIHIYSDIEFPSACVCDPVREGQTEGRVSEMTANTTRIRHCQDVWLNQVGKNKGMDVWGVLATRSKSSLERTLRAVPTFDPFMSFIIKQPMCPIKLMISPDLSSWLSPRVGYTRPSPPNIDSDIFIGVRFGMLTGILSLPNAFSLLV